MSVRPCAILTIVMLAACGGDATSPVRQITLEELPPAAVADLREAEQLELTRIEARRTASVATYDTLSAAWTSLQVSWGAKGSLLVCMPDAYDGAVSIIGPEGGRLQAGSTAIDIPAGALDSPTVITLETPVAFTLVAELRPHGLKFRRRVVLAIDYARCFRSKSWKERIAYIDDADRILEWPESHDQTEVDQVRALLGHFSRYAVAF